MLDPFSLDAPPSQAADDPTRLRGVTEVGLKEYYNVIYASPRGYRPLRLDLTVPTTTSDAPVTLVIHGGAWESGRNELSQVEPVDLASLKRDLLQAGFAVASATYRFSGEARFPAQLRDARAAVRWLRAAGPVLGFDGARIGVIGESAGGYLSVFLGTNAPEPTFENDFGVTEGSTHVQAAVGWYSPTRLDTMQAEALPTSIVDHDSPHSPESRLIGATVADRRDIARAASPIAHLEGEPAPMLLVHGVADRIVPWQQSEALATALRKRGREVELVLVPDADHVFLGVDVQPIRAATVAFLVRVLRPAAAGIPTDITARTRSAPNAAPRRRPTRDNHPN